MENLNTYIDHVLKEVPDDCQSQCSPQSHTCPVSAPSDSQSLGTFHLHCTDVRHSCSVIRNTHNIKAQPTAIKQEQSKIVLQYIDEAV